MSGNQRLELKLGNFFGFNQKELVKGITLSLNMRILSETVLTTQRNMLEFKSDSYWRVVVSFLGSNTYQIKYYIQV